MPNAPAIRNSLNQGKNFANMTKSYHGGRRKRGGYNKTCHSWRSGYNKTCRMRGGYNKTCRMRGGYNKTCRMRGGSFTPYAEYPTSMDSVLPTDMRELARIAPLDASFAELPSVMKGGARKSKRSKASKRKRGGSWASVNSPTMILSSPEEEAAARLNPQWYTENTVIPNFRGPIPIPGGTIAAPNPPAAKGGRRRSRNKRRY